MSDEANQVQSYSFWDKICYLSKLRGVKPHAVLKELGISSGVTDNWKKKTLPNGETLLKLSAYFDVSIDSLLDFNENVSIKLSDKKPTFRDLGAISQRFNSLRAVVKTTDEQKLAIAKYIDIPLGWLLDERYIEYKPKPSANSDTNKDIDTLFLILDIMDGCADNNTDRAMQIQLSRVALYHLAQKGFSAEKISSFKDLDQRKIHFILTGEENKDSTLNYGLNLSDLVYIMTITGIDFFEMFSGRSEKIGR